MKASVQLLAGVALLVLALGGADSYAQFGGRGGFGGMRGGTRGEQANQGKNQDFRLAQPESESYEQIEYRLSLLEEDLHLQPEQRALWEFFASKVRAYAGDLVREKSRAMTSASGGVAGKTGIQHIEQAADSARNRATALEDIAEAAKNLYAGLTPNQKALADARIVTIVAPQPRVSPAPGGGSNLPDLGSSGRTQR